MGIPQEFQACQALDTEAVEDELAASGIPVPPTMNDMEMRMMLVEMRLRKSGKVGPQKAKAKAKPGADASAFEVALYEKPAFSELYEEWKAARNTNAANLAIEHVNNARRAKERYGGTALYDETIAKIEAALNARVVKEVKGGALSYAGFPATFGGSDGESCVLVSPLPGASIGCCDMPLPLPLGFGHCCVVCPYPWQR